MDLAKSRIVAIVLFSLVLMIRGRVIDGFAYHSTDVENIMNVNESAVSSSVVIGKPMWYLCISVTTNQKAWKTVMSLAARVRGDQY